MCVCVWCVYPYVFASALDSYGLGTRSGTWLARQNVDVSDPELILLDSGITRTGTALLQRNPCDLAGLS